MRLRRRKEQPAEDEAVVRDAEGDPVEDPTVSGILPPLDSAPGGPEAVAIPQPPADLAPPEAEAVEPAPPPAPIEPPPEEPATVVAEPAAAEPAADAPAPAPEPEAAPEAAPDPAPEPEPTPEPARHEVTPAPPADVAVPASRAVGRPELLVGAAFVGGVAVAIVLRRLGRR